MRLTSPQHLTLFRFARDAGVEFDIVLSLEHALILRIINDKLLLDKCLSATDQAKLKPLFKQTSIVFIVDLAIDLITRHYINPPELFYTIAHILKMHNSPPGSNIDFNQHLESSKIMASTTLTIEEQMSALYKKLEPEIGGVLA